jgi:hypothetical protein
VISEILAARARAATKSQHFPAHANERLRRLPHVDTRPDRVARNEAMYRAVNREIEQASEQTGRGGDDQLEVLCECGEDGCSSTLALTITEYDQTHRQRDRFVVAPGHEDPEIERIVTRNEHYLVVDKFGEAERVAEAEERREGTD